MVWQPLVLVTVTTMLIVSGAMGKVKVGFWLLLLEPSERIYTQELMPAALAMVVSVRFTVRGAQPSEMSMVKPTCGWGKISTKQVWVRVSVPLALVTMSVTS